MAQHISFGLLPYIIHQALQARHEVEQAAATQLAAQARTQRLVALRTALSAAQLAPFEQQAAAALAHEGVARTQVGYRFLLRLRVDELLEQAFAPKDTAPETEV